MAKNWIRIFNRMIVLFPLTIMLGSCKQDLKMVEDFGLSSASLKDTSTKMIQDIYDSCNRLEVANVAYNNVLQERRATLSSASSQQESSRNFSISSTKQPNTNPVNNLSPEFLNSDSAINPYKFLPARIKAACKVEKANSDNVMQLNGVLVTYVETLGRLASHSTISFDLNLQGIKNAIIQTRAQLINPTHANLTDPQTQQFQTSLTDGANIAQSLLNLYADQKRFSKLKPIIICSNDSLSRYIKSLENLINDYYVTGAIEEEENQSDRYFDALYRLDTVKFGNNLERLNNELLMLSSEYDKKNQEINQKKDAALAYFAILQKTAATHNALASQFKGNMTPEAEKAFCANYFSTNGQKLNASQIQTEQLNSQEIQVTQKILQDYVKTVKPLTKKLEESF